MLTSNKEGTWHEDAMEKVSGTAKVLLQPHEKLHTATDAIRFP